MNTELLLNRAVKSALAVGAAGGLASGGVALAQQAPAPATTTQLSKIVVTGSHIPQTAIATAQPVVTINRQEIQNSGFTTVGEVLQHLSSSWGALNVQFNNGGNGAVLINIHDLGPARVLVLVNGQRWVSRLTGTVDLSTIPTAVVARIELLLNGAAAVYGSEAIAGVINIITVKNFNGARASAYLGMFDGTSDGGGWDGKLRKYSFTVGTSGDRSSVLLSGGYYQQEPVWAGDRNISQEPEFGAGVASGSGNTIGGRALFWYGQNGAPPGVDIPGCGPQGFFGYPGCDSNGPYIGAHANPHPFTDADRFNYAPLNYLRTPSERWYIYSQGHYDLTNSISFNFLTTYQRRNSHQVLAPTPILFGLLGGLNGYGANGIGVGVSADAKYNPWGVDLFPGYYSSSPMAAAWCSKYGSGANGLCGPDAVGLVDFGLRPLGLGLRDFNQNLQTFYFRGGFQGYWQMAGNQWQWSAHYIYGQSLNTVITAGLTNMATLQRALVGKCNTTPGCVPFNIFGGGRAAPDSDPESGITPAMRNFVTITAHAVNKIVLRDYNANIGGGFFNGWYAGPWGVAAGYEYMENDGFFSPDPLVANGNTDGNARKPTNGKIVTNAQYVELKVPLASDLPFAQSLVLDLANRWSQFDWNGQGNVIQPNNTVLVQPAGGSASSSTGRVWLKWKPINQLLIRASWSEGFRAPALSELFGGVGDNFPGLVDPCAPTTGNGGWVPGTPLPPGCNGLVHTQINSQIHTNVGGNVNLVPETSTTKSVGFVYSPSWAPGLDLSADYFHTVVENIITRLGGQYYLNQCYIEQNQAACDKIVTTPNGLIVANIFDFIGNGGLKKVIGWDVGANYRFPTTAIGQFTAELHMTFMQKDIVCNASGACGDITGQVNAPSAFFAQPSHRYNLQLGWEYGAWAANWNMTLISELWEPCDPGAGPGNCSNPEKFVGGDPVGQNHLGTTVYTDANVSYTVSSWNTTFTLGALNLFDKQPPISHQAFANSYLPVFYRTPGRFLYGRVTVRF
ncbi:MAG: TonB-dependent receptor [Gammaproteobacteria bacterium]|nr:TonB-dependent receptor [Gammaproteobacteria bacterium]